ncbi:protein of unknown function (plasmid) [Azospirillum baldaniorum]|uniref:Uncharacterized protein n=1 Tax=Azospirillum baldaniorum TaxID=1064539 RepID=A0A9P1NQE1_9PROT|nr:protein of unknown function [Azospirillum baldaniorum]
MLDLIICGIPSPKSTWATINANSIASIPAIQTHTPIGIKAC